MAKRIKVPGPFKYHELPDNAIYVGRAVFGYPKSKWANPFPVKRYGRDGSMRRYRAQLLGTAEDVGPLRETFLSDWKELVGHDLACWCHPDQECHADILLEAIATMRRHP